MSQDEKLREITAQEAAESFLDHLTSLAHYWANVRNDDRSEKTVLDRILGFAFSMLTTFDGGSGGSCGYHLVPVSCPEDIKFTKEELGENWYPAQETKMGKVRCKLHDEAIQLHELFSCGRWRQGTESVKALEPMLDASRRIRTALEEIAHQASQGDTRQVERLARNLLDQFPKKKV